MPHSGPDQHEAPASAAQVRDLSAQVQAMQARLAAHPASRPHRPLGPYLYGGILVLLILALAASLIRPVRTETRTVTQIRVVHDVRVVVQAATQVPAPPAGEVAVCTEAGFDQAAALCRVPTGTLNQDDLPNARIAYTGKGGGTFGATHLTLALGKASAGGGMVSLGRITLDVMLTSTSQASRLQGVFDALGAHAIPGTYLVEIDQGDTNLGAERFTISG
jgi:hypothetical protein